MSYHLENRDGEIWFITEDGSAFKLDNVLNHHWRLRRIDEIRDENTLRRLWWRRRVRSRDVPNSKEARADYSDNGAAFEYMVAALDGAFKHCRRGPSIDIATRNVARIRKKLMLVSNGPVWDFIFTLMERVVTGKTQEEAALDADLTTRGYQKRIDAYMRALGYRKLNTKRPLWVPVDNFS